MLGTVETVVFVSLVLDLFAFTIPLPLFPRIIEWYTIREAADPTGFLSRTLWAVQSLRAFFYNPPGNSRRWDIVLLGGLMGSLFSTLQFLVSPRIGSLSDKYGRKKILLLSMVGNLLSAIVWIQSTSFASFLLSRAIGGLSEGNVQLAIAILSDVTTPAARSRALALVGMAFSICFCIGPPVGAYFSSRPVPSTLWFGKAVELNIYATPAIITLVLLATETVFLWAALPETRGMRPIAEHPTNEHANEHSTSTSNGAVNGHAGSLTNGAASSHANGAASGHTDGEANGHLNAKAKITSRGNSIQARLAMLKTLRSIHFMFLGLFSGVEFTLTFLTFDLFDWSNAQNGRLIGFIGIISALLQGGYVRRSIPKIGEGVMARRGVQSCTLGLVALACLPQLVGTAFATTSLYVGAACLAFTSATVVTSLTSFASLQCDEGIDKDTGKLVVEHEQLSKGRALGEFRSAGQLGRAIGPLVACASYWTVGPSITYGVSAVAMAALVANMSSIARRRS